MRRSAARWQLAVLAAGVASSIAAWGQAPPPPPVVDTPPEPPPVAVYSNVPMALAADGAVQLAGARWTPQVKPMQLKGPAALVPLGSRTPRAGPRRPSPRWTARARSSG